MMTSEPVKSLLFLNIGGDIKAKLALEQLAYRFVEASSVLEAWRLLSQRAFDGVVIAVDNDSREELSFLKKSKQHTKLCHLAYFLLATKEDLVEKEFRQQCDDFLIFPGPISSIEDKLQHRLSLSAARRCAQNVQLQRQMKRTITTLSHEFRTPLVSILTGTEVLKQQLDDAIDPGVLELLESVHRGGQRLEALVGDFLILQKEILGKQGQGAVPAPLQTPLFPLVSNAVQNFVDYLDASSACCPDIRLIHEVREVENQALVEVFDDHITDMLKRLLTNAYKFGGDAGPIEVRIAYNASAANVIIRDYGPGFQSEQELEEIFDPFRQFHREQREQQGCGLGLPISRLLASLNGVQLSLTAPNEGPGAEAHLKFPLFGI